METLGTTEVARAAGLTYRQMDYLMRTGVIEPAAQAPAGSGTIARWATSQLPMIRLLGTLRAHGAEADTLRGLVAEAEGLSPEGWRSRVVVTRDGRIVTPLSSGAVGWLIDLAEMSTPVTPERAAAVEQEMALAG